MRWSARNGISITMEEGPVDKQSIGNFTVGKAFQKLW